MLWCAAFGFARDCGCCQLEVPSGVGVHAAAATRVGRLHRSHRVSVAVVTLAEALPIQQTPPTTRTQLLASALQHASNEGCNKKAKRAPEQPQSSCSTRTNTTDRRETPQL